MSVGTAGLIIGGVMALTGAVQAGVSAKQARKARKYAKSTEGRIEALEGDRQETIDPYDQMTGLGSMIYNPAESMGVATKAAEFAAEEMDITLANQQATQQAFGFAGGGATALTREKARGKLQISAGIEKQERQNQILEAQGESQAMAMRLNEARRMQAMEAQGRAYQFETQENREMARLDRLAKTATGYRQMASQGQTAAWQAAGNTMNNMASLYFMSQMGGGGGGGATPTGTAVFDV